MVNFTKILGLAGAAAVFSGLAYGQATCGAPVALNLGIIRAEGTTEQVSQLQFTCTVPAGFTASAGQASLQIFLSPALPVTSKVLSTSSGQTEALLQVNGAAPGSNTAGTAGSVQGTVSGSTISFSGVQLPALTAGQSYTFLVSNVRVNATSLTVGAGVPPTVAELGFISGSATTIVPAALASTTVAFAQNGLNASKTFTTFKTSNSFPSGTASTSGTNNFVVCNAYSPRLDAQNFFPNPAAATTAGPSMAFVVQINENFAGAFKQVGTAGSGSTVGTGEQSQVPTATSNAVVDGTRLQVNFANVPANVTLYVPNAPILSQASGNAGIIQLTSSAPGTVFAPVAGSTSTSITTGTGLTSTNGLAAVTVSSGTGSAVFEVTSGDLTALDQFNIPVFVVTSANSVAASGTGITTSVSFNPIGSTVIPNFAVTSSTTTLTGSIFSSCSTSLLFPFVTNQLGFDTGLAIANTSSDPFAANLGGATAQAGTCTLNFYGAGAPSPSNVVTPVVPTGTVYTQVLSGVAAGFQGYMIAYCQFQYAHGFAFVTNGVGASGGLSQGYLAGVIPDVNQVPRAANGVGAPKNAANGLGESLAN